MGKNSNLKILARFIALGVAHKVGQLINPNSLYAEKYDKESMNFMEQAKDIKQKENWNSYDKEEIRKEVKTETIKELNQRTYLDNKKFDITDSEIDKSLKEIGLY